MAEEPQPPQSTKAPPTLLPEKTSAEDRKAAAALSSLDARGEDDDAPAGKKEVDTEALGKAMRGWMSRRTGEERGGKEEGCGQVEQLELSKAKATELLKAHEGDAVKAMCAFVTASA
ncbi:hypothetical protein H2199_003800 [Coniosporium tulheliwenetii]|uniref:Uncharacterized protein n=1 Tax=Coniosporium tulheliwenetii TaxID=3383036 RepID=A0ACC2Z8S7_9PEZI|nr:hypothetical protein H2199_003800 [Cladosporium sp. JES 115]